MVTGEPIFPDAGVYEMLTKHLNEMPVAPSVRTPGLGLPPQAEALIRQMLAKSRDERPQTMEQCELLLESMDEFAPLLGLGSSSASMGSSTFDRTILMDPHSGSSFLGQAAASFAGGTVALEGMGGEVLAAHRRPATHPSAPSMHRSDSGSPSAYPNPYIDSTPTHSENTESSRSKQIKWMGASAGGIFLLALIGWFALRPSPFETSGPDSPVKSAGLGGTQQEPEPRAEVRPARDPAPPAREEKTDPPKPQKPALNPKK
jgi:hypothetical protein